MSSIRREFPILEFDPNPTAFIDPSHNIAPVPDMPERMVICFYSEAIAAVLEECPHRAVASVRSEGFELTSYAVVWKGREVGLIQAMVGAPIAAGMIDELSAMGARKFMVTGSCGVLQPDIAIGHLIIPNAAVRDEGTSYHYAPPAREIGADPAAVAAIERVLTERGVPYITAKTWTIDSFYRETPAKIALRREEGCVSVEMEASAFMAAAQFRGVTLGQILYAGDTLGGEAWDRRGFETRADIRRSLLDLTLDICLQL